MKSGHQTSLMEDAEDITTLDMVESPSESKCYSKWDIREVAVWIASLGNNESKEFNDYARRFYDLGISGSLLKHLNYQTVSKTLKIRPPFSFEILNARDRLLGIEKN